MGSLARAFAPGSLAAWRDARVQGDTTKVGRPQPTPGHPRPFAGPRSRRYRLSLQLWEEPERRVPQGDQRATAPRRGCYLSVTRFILPTPTQNLFCGSPQKPAPQDARLGRGSSASPCSGGEGGSLPTRAAPRPAQHPHIPIHSAPRLLHSRTVLPSGTVLQWS